MDIALKIPYFIKKRRFPTPGRPLLKGSNLFLMQKPFFKPFSRGLQGVGDLLFFIKHGIYRAVSMHFSNSCMHTPYIVQHKKNSNISYTKCTVFKINIFARNTVGHNNPMIALKLAISGPFRGAKNSCSQHF